MFVGKHFYASGAYAGDRYEGDYKDGTCNGNGNKSHSTPYHPTQPQSNKMFIIIIIIAVCGASFCCFVFVKKTFIRV